MFKKENLKPLLVLGTICILVAAILAAINTVTGPKIQRIEEQKVYDSLREALDGEFEPADIPAGAPSSVTGVYKVTDKGELVGNVVTVEKQGYASKIVLTVGIKADGTVNRVVVTAQQESHGKDINPLLNGFPGVSAEGVGDVEHVSGATVTSKTIKEAVADAFKAISPDSGDEEEEPEALPKTDEEIIALAKELVGEECQLTDVTPEDTDLVKRIYKVSGNKGYVAYTVSISENYGTVDTENLIFIGNNGAIKNIKKLTWSVSPAAPDWGYNPPSDEKVDELYSSLVGKDSDSIGDVELKTGATNTTTTLVNSITEALNAANELIKQDLPRPEAEIEALAKELAGGDVELEKVTPEKTTNVKLVYRVSGNKGYIVYVFTIAERYGTVDTENLVYIGTNGAIKNISKLTWSVSDAAPDWGYNPPTDEEMDQFYEGLNGKDKNTIGDVELSTGATNTTTVLVDTLKEALDVVGELIKQDLPRPEAEIIELAKELVGEDVELSNITPDGTNKVKLVYRVSGNKGYVVYVFTIAERYGTVDTENLIYIGTNGAIKKINKLTWSVSDAAPDWGYNPPTDEEMDQFYEGLVGKDKNTIGDVELSTGATNTTTVLVDTLKEALDVVGEILKNDLPRPEAEIEAIIKEMVGEGEVLVNITPADAALVKRLYRVEGGKGYVAYTVAISPNYGTVETEALIYINNQGKITAIEKLLWKVSDPAPDWGYIPPDNQRVDQLFNDFIGRNLDTVGEVDLKTGATSTGTRLLECVTKALEFVDALENSNTDDVVAEDNNIPRVVGIAVIAAVAVGVAAYIALPIITKRRKNG